jgi:hypothetical protein
MKYRTRTYYTDSQKALMWERWKQGVIAGPSSDDLDQLDETEALYCHP